MPYFSLSGDDRLDRLGAEALKHLGGFLLYGRYPTTVAFTPTWQSQTAHQGGPGFRAQVAGDVSDVGGPLIKTPDEVRTHINLVDARVRSLNDDIHANVTSSSFLRDWDAFGKSWSDFRDTNQSLTHLVTTGLGTVDRQTDAFEVQVNDWRDALTREAPGGHFRTGPNKTPSAGWPWWAIVGVTLAGVGGLAYLAWKIQNAEAHAVRHAVGLDLDPEPQHDYAPRPQGFVGMPIYAP
jgi:hypothetical protein